MAEEKLWEQLGDWTNNIESLQEIQHSGEMSVSELEVSLSAPAQMQLQLCWMGFLRGFSGRDGGVPESEQGDSSLQSTLAQANSSSAWHSHSQGNAPNWQHNGQTSRVAIKRT